MDYDGIPNNRHGTSYPCQGFQELDDAGPPEVRVLVQQVIMPAQVLALWADIDSGNHRNSAMGVADLIDRRHSWGRKGAPDSGSHHEASLIYENKMVSAFF
jgi:hypothetical protein